MFVNIKISSTLKKSYFFCFFFFFLQIARKVKKLFKSNMHSKHLKIFTTNYMHIRNSKCIKNMLFNVTNYLKKKSKEKKKEILHRN